MRNEWKVLMNEWIKNKRGLNEWRMREEYMNEVWERDE